MSPSGPFDQGGLKSMRIALYARVSLDNGEQDPENQLRELRAYCERRGWTEVVEYVDRATGKNAYRDEFKRLFRDAHQRKFDQVVFWSLDRFTREGVLETLQHLRRLTDYGIVWHSHQEEHLDTAGPFKEVFVSFFAAMAKVERDRISERIKAGIQNKRRAKGLPVGRRATVDYAALMARRGVGASYTQLAHEFNISRRQVIRITKRA
jgi:DNA invertase Pin-like site-specific DNA recombinase